MTGSRGATARRWALLLVALSAVWLLVPGNVPLYDGVGFPDEPYRSVPATDPALPAATAAVVTLPLEGGVNPGGLIGNSAEQGPQVSFFAPPQAFAAAAEARSLVVAATPTVLVAPKPDGRVVSNVYRLTFTAGGAPAQLRPQAQAPLITMRAVDVEPPEPVFFYRPEPAAAWARLSTQRVGMDIFSTKAPGAGEYVLSSARPPARPASNRLPLLLALGAGIVVVGGTLLGIRLSARRRA